MAKTAKIPYAGKEAKNGRLPVPPPKSATSVVQSDKKATPAPRGKVAIASKDFAGDLAIPARESAVDQGVVKHAKRQKAKVEPSVAERVAAVKKVLGKDDPGPLPESLKVENRKPLTKAQQARVDAAKAKSRPAPADHQVALREGQKATKAEKAIAKRNAKREKAHAVAAGKTTEMPKQGREALKAIKAAQAPKAPPAKKNAPRATPAPGNGHLNKTRANEAKRQAQAKAGKAKAAPKAPGSVKPGSKLAAIVDLLKRKSGCTRADVLKVTGWPSVSMQQQAAAAGLALRLQKEGAITRYFGS